jgi:hypothetical protein
VSADRDSLRRVAFAQAAALLTVTTALEAGDRGGAVELAHELVEAVAHITDERLAADEREGAGSHG